MSDRINDGGPAFPPVHNPETHESGMSLRDWFAGQALADCLAHSFGNDWGKAGKEHIPLAAKRAYAVADAMLAARKGGDA